MRILASKKLALILIIALTIYSVWGMLEPQDKRFEVFSTPVFYLLVAIFFINTFSCTIKQIRILLKGNGINPQYSSREPFFKVVYTSELDDIYFGVTSFLAKNKYSLTIEEEKEKIILKAEKNKISKWSSVFFHVSLLLVIIGVLVSLLFKMDGIILLVEGQRLSEDHGSYVSITEGPLFREEGHTGKHIFMQKINLYYDKQNKIINEVEDVFTFGEEQFTMKASKPLNVKGFSIYHNKLGYAVDLKLVNTKNQQIQVITAPLYRGKFQNHNNYEGSFLLPGGYPVKAKLYPDVQNIMGQLNSKTNILKNPLLSIDIKSSVGKSVYTGNLAQGAQVKLEDYSLTFAGISKWSALRLVKEPGIPIIYSGFFISVFSVGMMFLFPVKTVYVQVTKTLTGVKVIVNGKASRFPAAFREELEIICSELNVELEAD